jgi:hypothetical protein
VVAPLDGCDVVLPGGGGFGASTIPWLGGVVEGEGTVSNGTELVVGNVEAVGEVLLELPFTSLAGGGMLPGPDVAPAGTGGETS